MLDAEPQIVEHISILSFQKTQIKIVANKGSPNLKLREVNHLWEDDLKIWQIMHFHCFLTTHLPTVVDN